jgi:hypothetical protein
LSFVPLKWFVPDWARVRELPDRDLLLFLCSLLEGTAVSFREDRYTKLPAKAQAYFKPSEDA